MSWLHGKPGWRSESGDVNAIGKLTVGLQQTAALLFGSGTSASYKTKSTADKNFLGFYLESSATSGTSRGQYLKLKLSGGAGGEAGRFFTTNESNTPADTVNGVHNSLSFGTTVGNVTGLGNASRNTVHIPGRAINGTINGVMSEFYGDAASGAIGGQAALFGGTVDGHANLKDSFDDNGYVLNLQGLTAGSGHCFQTGLTESTIAGNLSATLKVRIGAATYYIPLADALA
jgi:hypothetical protein